MSLKKDTAYVFVSIHGRLAIPLEHVHILKDCANIDYDWAKDSGKRWKLSTQEMDMNIIDPETITAIITEARLKGAS
jgi:hypothetical protein